METERKFYQVSKDIRNAPTCDHLMHGYETRSEFAHALLQIVHRWHDRIGECIEERNGFLRLRFYDTPGGMPDEAWLPHFLLCSVPMPVCYKDYDKMEEELNRAFEID